MIAEKPVIYNGIQYPTVKAAAKANGAKSSIMSWRIRQGYLSDDAVPPKNKAFVLDGIEYESLREAARITGHKRETLKNWIEQGRGYYK
jgi:DNA invertase Pin-like site-specific DNA recombinase